MSRYNYVSAEKWYPLRPNHLLYHIVHHKPYICVCVWTGAHACMHSYNIYSRISNRWHYCNTSLLYMQPFCFISYTHVTLWYTDNFSPGEEKSLYSVNYPHAVWQQWMSAARPHDCLLANRTYQKLTSFYKSIICLLKHPWSLGTNMDENG